MPESTRRDTNSGHLRHLIWGTGPLTVDLALKFEHEFGIPVIPGISADVAVGLKNDWYGEEIGV